MSPLTPELPALEVSITTAPDDDAVPTPPRRHLTGPRAAAAAAEPEAEGHDEKEQKCDDEDFRR